jgi:hypothetical protein
MALLSRTLSDWPAVDLALPSAFLADPFYGALSPAPHEGLGTGLDGYFALHATPTTAARISAAWPSDAAAAAAADSHAGEASEYAPRLLARAGKLAAVTPPPLSSASTDSGVSSMGSPASQYGVSVDPVPPTLMRARAPAGSVPTAALRPQLPHLVPDDLGGADMLVGVGPERTSPLPGMFHASSSDFTTTGSGSGSGSGVDDEDEDEDEDEDDEGGAAGSDPDYIEDAQGARLPTAAAVARRAARPAASRASKAGPPSAMGASMSAPPSLASRRQERNRVAARRSREKKKEYVQELEATAHALVVKNKDLLRDIRRLRKEVAELRGLPYDDAMECAVASASASPRRPAQATPFKSAPQAAAPMAARALAYRP